MTPAQLSLVKLILWDLGILKEEALASLVLWIPFKVQFKTIKVHNSIEC